MRRDYDPDEGSALAGQTMSDSVTKSAIAAAPERRTWVGVIVALAAAAAFALANTSASVAYHGGSNALTVAATRFIVPAAALVVWMRISGIPLRLAKRDALAAASLGVITALYNWAILRAFSSIPFALAVLILYLFPLMAAAIVAGLGWEKFAWRTIAAVVVAFAGLALALNVRDSNLNFEGVALLFCRLRVGHRRRRFRPHLSQGRCAAGDPLHGGDRVRVAVDAVCRKRGVHIAKHGFGMGGLQRRRRALWLRDDWLFHCRLHYRPGAGIAPFLC